MREIRKVLGEIPILASEQRLLDEAAGESSAADNEEGESKEKEKEKAKAEGAGRPKVLADGTYATETAFTSAAVARLEAVKAAAKPPLRSEFFYRRVPLSFSIYLMMALDSSHPRRRLLHWLSAFLYTHEARPPLHGSLYRRCGLQCAQG